jgi:nitrogenase molybdenum-iron protein alpha/beta subunit
VNILGISLHHKYFAGDIAELKRLLNLCQIRVNCCLCAESDLAEIRDIPAAALNLVVHPEYGLRTAEYLKSRFGTPFISAGPPIGFAATEALMSQVCSQLKVDDAAFIEESERARARAYAHISRVNSLTGLPKGVGFAVEGSYSELYAYLNFLIHYLAMVPAALKPLSQSSDCFQARLETLLDEIDLVELLEQARQDSFEQNSTAAGADVILASGVTIARAKLSGHRFVGIETALPTIGYLDIVPKTHLGVQGALFLTEQVLNALLF